MNGRILTAALLLACAAAAPSASPGRRVEPVAEPAEQSLSLDDAFTQIADYQFGSPTLPLETIARAATDAAKDPAKREAMAARLATLLDFQYVPETRLFALRELVKVAGPKQIPALTEQLDSEKLSPAALHLLVHLAHPDAAAAVRDALPQMGQLPKYAAIAALGRRRDERAMDLLRQLVCDCDPETAAVILPTLAEIGTPDAVRLIKDKLDLEDDAVRLAAQDAYLLVADRLLASGDRKRAAALYEEVLDLDKALPGPRMAALRGLFQADPAKAKKVAKTVLKSDDRTQRANAEHLLRTVGG